MGIFNRKRKFVMLVDTKYTRIQVNVDAIVCIELVDFINGDTLYRVDMNGSTPVYIKRASYERLCSSMGIEPMVKDPDE